MTPWMVVDRGFSRETVVACQVEDCGIAGRITCLECAGSGRFEGPDFEDACVECKGTGKIYVSL